MTSSRTRDDSPAAAFLDQFGDLGPDVGPRVVLAAWDQLPVIEQAAIAADWSFWARSKQLSPAGQWLTWGFLTGRGYGKTVSIANHINDEVEAGRATLIGLAAQDEQSSIDIQVEGPSGLVTLSKPWFKARFDISDLQVVWPNGARAYVRTPEVPGKIRGLEYQLFWASELQSWPKATREEALDNVFLSTRLGYSRVVWDSTSKRRHPLLKKLLANAEAAPSKHVVVRGSLYENAANLGSQYVAEMRRKYEGTQRGREEIHGEMLDDSENALVKQAWIDEARRAMPGKLARRVVSIDPAVTNRKGSDTTGIIDAGLGFDGQEYVFEDASGKMDPEKWAAIVLDWYVKKGLDLVIAETNKGGSLVATTLRVLARERGLEVIVLGRDERTPPRMPGKVFVREVYARGAKEDRAEPMATAYERKRISHVAGADLTSLEDTLTTWEPAPGADSPGDLDALVHASVELLDLQNNEPDPLAAFKGIQEVGRQLAQPPAATSSLAQLFTTALGSGRGDRI